MIKNKSDFLLGIAMLPVGLFLSFSNSIISGMSLFQTTIALGQADTYLKIIGFLLSLLSLFILVRSFLIAEVQSSSSWKEHQTAIIFFPALFLYLLMLEKIGFIIDSIFLLTLTTFLIRAKETHLDIYNRREFFKSLGKSFVFSILCVLILVFIFTTWLHVRLP